MFRKHLRNCGVVISGKSASSIAFLSLYREISVESHCGDINLTNYNTGKRLSINKSLVCYIDNNELARKKSAPKMGWDTSAKLKDQVKRPEGNCSLTNRVPYVLILLPLATLREGPGLLPLALDHIGVARIFDWEEPKPQITCNDVIRNFQKRNFL